MATIEQQVLPPIGPECAGIRMTVEEFDAITEYDDLYDYELINGILVVNPIPSEQEGGSNERLGVLLWGYHDNHPQGAALDNTLTERYVFQCANRRRADRVIWCGLGRQPQPRIDVPTIVAEFVSSGKRSWRRDYLEKRIEYLEAGALEYWVIDRFARTMTVYTSRPGRPAEQTIREDEIYRTDLLPSFELPFARLLAASDRWEESS